MRFGISYEELRARPNYWTIEKQIKLHNDTKARNLELEFENARLKEILAKPPKLAEAVEVERVSQGINTDASEITKVLVFAN